jgi:MoaA/NifB/PqqE/SkfB family radical SAM enzyme
VEPERQVEIQLGHMCNNRCVFCVSGQRTALREAFPIAADPVIEKLRQARERGLTKVTLLGGEPTIQPEFFTVLRAAIDLGFEEIVIFTNGVKTARAGFVDEILATGGNFTFRLSFQGATGRAHDRTTKKLGSFERLRESLANLRDRGQRITINMCVVRSNYESVEAFPALILPFGVTQLHLDMIRPLDAGERTEGEMREMLPRYSDMVPSLTRMIAGFPAGFDVNIGNLPYCIAPELAPFIHHDGNTTFTIAVDGDDSLSEPWDKYENKRRDKVKLESCRTCVFDAQCGGVFDTYRRFYGREELVPVTRARLPIVDPERRMFTLHAEPLIEELRAQGAEVHVDSHAQRVAARFPSGLEIALAAPGGGAAGTDAFSLHVVRFHPSVRALFAKLTEISGARVIHDLADDARGELDARIARCLARLRAGAPYTELTWKDARVDAAGRSAQVDFAHQGGAAVTLAFSVHGDGVRGGYKVDRTFEVAPPGLVEGVRAAMKALSGR